jgi:hypothetical protein
VNEEVVLLLLVNIHFETGILLILRSTLRVTTLPATIRASVSLM